MTTLSFIFSDFPSSVVCTAATFVDPALCAPVGIIQLNSPLQGLCVVAFQHHLHQLVLHAPGRVTYFSSDGAQRSTGQVKKNVRAYRRESQFFHVLVRFRLTRGP
jgi:hypothetical protein